MRAWIPGIPAAVYFQGQSCKMILGRITIMLTGHGKHPDLD
jgi:hypothetical protein